MPLRPEKRAFLVRVLGEARVKALEEGLPRAEKQLEAMGIGWKEAASLKAAICPEGPDCATGYATDLEEVVAVAVPAGGPTSFEEVEAEDAAREEAAEARSLTATFDMLIGNIMNLPEADAAAKLKLLEQAMTELKARVVKVGSKALASSPAARYVQDLVGGGTGAKDVDQATVQAEAKRLAESGAPAAAIVGDLLLHGAVR